MGPVMVVADIGKGSVLPNTPCLSKGGMFCTNVFFGTLPFFGPLSEGRTGKDVQTVKSGQPASLDRKSQEGFNLLGILSGNTKETSCPKENPFLSLFFPAYFPQTVFSKVNRFS